MLTDDKNKKKVEGETIDKDLTGRDVMDYDEYKMKHEPGNKAVHIFIHRITASIKGIFREAISNSLDAGAKRISITITPERIIIDDDGTGILNIPDFAKYAEDTKKLEAEASGKSFIGEFHLGKLAGLKICDPVVYLTNNGEGDYRIEMTEPRTKDDDGFIVRKARIPGQYRNTRGTALIYEHPKNIQNFKDLINEVYEEMNKIFAKKLFDEPDIQFSVNGKTLKSDSLEFKTINVRLPFMGVEEGIVGNIYAGGHGSIRVYCRGVFVAEVIIDPLRSFQGWVNCDFLQPQVTRTEFNIDDLAGTHKAFKQLLKDYVREAFPKRTLEQLHEYESMKNKAAMIIWKFNQQYVPRNERLGIGGNPGDEKQKGRRGKGTKKGTVKPTGKGGKHKNFKNPQPGPNRVSGTGLVNMEMALDDSQSPLIFQEPNYLVWNTSNMLLMALMNPIGSKTIGSGNPLVKLSSYMGRVCIDMRKKEMLTKERQNEEDRATRFVIRNLIPKAELADLVAEAERHKEAEVIGGGEGS